MGTKINPGNYDCYAKLASTEPFFVLRAKDALAPDVVRTWARDASLFLGVDHPKIVEAYRCAGDMERWPVRYYPNDVQVVGYTSIKSDRYTVCLHKIEQAKQAGNKPRVHGNGFIQLDISKDERLHFWGNPEVPRQKVYTGIHDHVFGFSSTCLAGRIFQIPYVEPKNQHGTYQIYTPVARDGEDTVLEPTNSFTDLHYDTVLIVSAGETYSMKPFEIHETTTDTLAITLMTKTSRVNVAKASVYVPRHLKPDNEFNRNNVLSEDAIWDIVMRHVQQCFA